MPFSLRNCHSVWIEELVFEKFEFIYEGDPMAALSVLPGVLAGSAIAAGSSFSILHFIFGVNNATVLVAASVAGLVGGVYSALAFARGIYGLAPFSILGYLLDMSWSLPNTAASLLVWLPACMIAGGDFVEPDANSRRSGTFVYRLNPRGSTSAAWCLFSSERSRGLCS
jgi:hypothetical protein